MEIIPFQHWKAGYSLLRNSSLNLLKRPQSSSLAKIFFRQWLWLSTIFCLFMSIKEDMLIHCKCPNFMGLHQPIGCITGPWNSLLCFVRNKKSTRKPPLGPYSLTCSNYCTKIRLQISNLHCAVAIKNPEQVIVSILLQLWFEVQTSSCFKW